MISDLGDRLRSVRERIARSCEIVKRDPGSVSLLAVTKTVPIAVIKEAYDLGHRDFGENRLQEAQPKVEALPADIRWHFIGTLQTNKTRRIAGLFDAVHTFCSEAQIREAGKAETPIDGLIEVNIAEEAQKSGLLPNGLDDFAKKLLECPKVRFRGLMTIGPPVDDPEAMRPYFRRLRDLNEKVGGEWLSMGMSHDFEVAVQEGSTHVRVGTALFGARSALCSH